jgi:hypothetical protein
MTAVISFYIQAAAVSAKRDQVSDRLRRFHLGLDKIEQTVREGRLIQVSTFRITLFHLSDLAEQDGFPDYSPHPMQFVSKKDGLHQIFGDEDKVILPYKPGERMIFTWLQENPLDPVQKTLLSLEMYYSGAEDSRSDLLFRRTLNVDNYFGRP